jgi:ribosomal protein S18 acetylase RimI-like enzyme
MRVGRSSLTLGKPPIWKIGKRVIWLGNNLKALKGFLMTLQIKRATLEEVALVHRIMQEAFAGYIETLQPPSGANRETVADAEQAMTEGGAVLAWKEAEAVGSARFRLRPDHFYVERVSVLPTHRGKGIAKAMMGYLEELACHLNQPEMRVGVRMSLPGNLALYQGLGFEIISKTPHPKGVDMVALLVKPL